MIDAMADLQLAQVGQPISLRCIAAGSPLPTITWTLDGIAVERLRNRPIADTLRKATVSDGGKAMQKMAVISALLSFLYIFYALIIIVCISDAEKRHGSDDRQCFFRFLYLLRLLLLRLTISARRLCDTDVRTCGQLREFHRGLGA